MIPAWLSMLDGLAAVVLATAGISAAHFEIISATLGLQAFILGNLMALFAVLIGILGLFRTATVHRDAGRPKAIAGVILGLCVGLPSIAAIAYTLGNPAAYPLIGDITTNFTDPPNFIHATTLPANQDRDLSYQRGALQPIQTAAYGAIGPVETSEPPAVAFEHVKIVAAEMPDWRITYADPRQLSLEGVATSPVFHFKSDFVINVRSAGKGSVIEMRSKSREGPGDFGANAARIRSFFAILARNQNAGAEPLGAVGAP